jgi:hypothetical protein
MPGERLYVVAYDIGHPKRWRRVFKLMHGYGRWLQLSVFQCRLSARRRAELAARLDALTTTPRTMSSSSTSAPPIRWTFSVANKRCKG